MGRIINETDSSTIADTDYLLKDNATTGTTKWSGANLKTQLEIVARKGVASGYAELDSTGKVPAAQLRSAFTIEQVADAAARNALTVISAEVGVRQVRLADTGVIYVPNAAGTGSGIWIVYNSQGYASTSAQGNVELATTAEGLTGTSALLVPAVDVTRAMVAQQRAPLATGQALLFDGTAGCTLAAPAVLTKWSLAFRLCPTSLSSYNTIIHGASAGALYVYYTSAGALVIEKVGTGVILSVASAVEALRHDMFCITHDGATLTVYRNGISIGSTADTTNWSAATSYFGSTASPGEYVIGLLALVGMFNRALSAADALALYFRGVPGAGEYNSASNTSLVSGADSDFSGAGSWTVNGSSTISGGKLNLADGDNCSNPLVAVTIGKPLRFTVTVDSVTAGNVQYYNGTAYVNFATGAGTYTVEFTPTATVATGLNLKTSGGNAVLDTFLAYNLGVVVALEPTAPGNGYQWRDASGNKIDLTLPTSGVAWALRDSRPNFVRGTLTWAGTHEAKSLLSQRALPTGAVVTLITRDATAASSGAGCTIGTTGTATKWQAADTYTTAKEVATLAAQLPSDDTANQNDIVVDPDDANYTGSISVDVYYALTQGT
jgi:hypothetical protein